MGGDAMRRTRMVRSAAHAFVRLIQFARTSSAAGSTTTSASPPAPRASSSPTAARWASSRSEVPWDECPCGRRRPPDYCATHVFVRTV